MLTSVILKERSPGTFLVVQWLRLHASNAGAQVLSLTRELRSRIALWHDQRKNKTETAFLKIQFNKFVNKISPFVACLCRPPPSVQPQLSHLD